MSKNYGNDSQMSEIVKFISDTMKIPVLGVGGGFAPLGMYGFSCDYVLTPPQGWLFADGSIYNIADYPEYAALLASQHGRANIYGGDGVTTFATKDLRGEFIRGWGQNSHANQGDGANVGVHQDGTLDNYVFGGDGYLITSNDGLHISNTDHSTKANTDVYIQGTSRSSTSDQTMSYTSRPTNTSVAFFVKATVAGDPNAHQYSTEEQIVGKWIDGSDVYEITMTKDSLGDGGIIGNIGTGRKIKDGSGAFALSSGNMFVFSYGNAGTEDVSYYYEASTGNIKLNTNIGTLTNISVTIQYTKTSS